MKTTKAPHEIAEIFDAALATVAETSVQVVCRDRHIPRKEQARLARELFKRLGLKGVSVTTPNYSMAQVVDVKIPALEIHVSDMWPHGGPLVNYSSFDVTVENRCPTCRKNQLNREKVEEILARAFPNHDDRSESQSDYFDSCWSVD